MFVGTISSHFLKLRIDMATTTVLDTPETLMLQPKLRFFKTLEG